MHDGSTQIINIQGEPKKCIRIGHINVPIDVLVTLLMMLMLRRRRRQKHQVDVRDDDAAAAAAAADDDDDDEDDEDDGEDNDALLVLKDLVRAVVSLLDRQQTLQERLLDNIAKVYKVDLYQWPRVWIFFVPEIPKIELGDCHFRDFRSTKLKFWAPVISSVGKLQLSVPQLSLTRDAVADNNNTYMTWGRFAVQSLDAARETRDLMTSQRQSRDAAEEWLRGCVDEERSLRRDAMTSQRLLQRALVDCLQQRQQPQTAGSVRAMLLNH